MAVTVVANVFTAYAIYFDHKRQSDPNFRKSLKKNNKKVEISVKQQQEAAGEARVADLKNALESVKKNGELPTGLEEKEAYFMEQVAKGESLCASEGAENEAAISFWKALKVYPQPQVRLHPSLRFDLTCLIQFHHRTLWASMSAQFPQTSWRFLPNLSPSTLARPLPPSPVPVLTTTSSNALPFTFHTLYFRPMEFSNLYGVSHNIFWAASALTACDLIDERLSYGTAMSCR